MEALVESSWGVETRFSFKIISFFSSPLERQVGEAVRILRTGAEQVLNSKSENNRCKIPRIVAKDDKEVLSLGDTEQQTEVDMWEVQREAREERRKNKQ